MTVALHNAINSRGRAGVGPERPTGGGRAMKILRDTALATIVMVLCVPVGWLIAGTVSYASLLVGGIFFGHNGGKGLNVAFPRTFFVNGFFLRRSNGWQGISFLAATGASDVFV